MRFSLRPTLRAGFGVALLLLAASPTAARHWRTAEVADGFVKPVAVVNAGDDRLFVVSNEGRIWVIQDGQRLPTPYLDIRSKVRFSPEGSSELGLLSAAFHPNYASNGYFFVAYTRDSDGAGVVARYEVSGPNPNQSPAGSERVLLTVPQPGANHNLNHLAFGPDGRLYISSGDGGYQPEPRCTPQEGGNLLGKVLRLDVDAGAGSAPYHSIPADNPFVGDPSVEDEIWSLGLRNPWRFAFDRQTGDLWLTDVGQDTRDEINFVAGGGPGGQNWGWKMMEGSNCRGLSTNCSEPIPGCFDPAYSPPVIDYGQDARRCAIIGGHVYRGSAIPDMIGSFLVGDFCGATFLARRNGGGFELEELSVDIPEIVSFGEGADGESYLLQGDTLYRIVDLVNDASVAFSVDSYQVGEGDGVGVVSVRRQGDAEGAVTVSYAAEPFSASVADFQPTFGTLSWADGEVGDKTFQVPILDDAIFEGTEEIRLRIFDAVGAELGDRAEARLAILDDEGAGAPCVPTDLALCLGPGGRFQVTGNWRDFEGQVGVAHAVPLSPLASQLEDSGVMWFFNLGNAELLVKVLDACGVNGHHWAFLSAATSVEYTVEILDTETGAVRRYSNGLGQASPAVTDTQAFSCL
ncbi:MAG: PQQ-dependent sugar dehydrogenase [Acidobacteriota bacterium]